MGIDEALKFVQSKFEEELTSIFDYYAKLTTQRRIKESSGQVKGFSLKSEGSQYATSNPTAEVKKKRKADMEEVVDYKEFMQEFAIDFNLKSTNFLSAIQIGEVFLNVAKLDEEDFVVNGMTVLTIIITIILTIIT